MTSRQQMTSREHNRYEYYKGHYYANKLQVNNENDHDTNNGTNKQYETPLYDDKIEEMVHFPDPTEAEDKEVVHLPVPTEGEDKKQKYAVIQMKSTGHEEDVEDVNRT